MLLTMKHKSAMEELIINQSNANSSAVGNANSDAITAEHQPFYANSSAITAGML